MGDPISRASTRAGVSFEVERLEHEDDEFVVRGHWSGLRGVRFVRPTLLVGGRQVLATLEHKPWAQRTDRAWIAAFPWKGSTPDASELELSVAPSVTVPLGPPGDTAPEPEPEPALMLVSTGEPPARERVPEPPPAAAPKRRSGETDRMRVRLLEQELDGAEQERDALRTKLEEAQLLLAAADAARVDLEANIRRERRSADVAGETRDEVARSRTAAERDRDIALAQLDEAVQDREAAVRTRTRMELANEEAMQAQTAAEAALARAHSERDEAQSQRDEVLLAYRGLQRHVQSERAGIDRAENPDGERGAGEDFDEPLGVRTMPAARTIMAELQRPKPSSKFVISQFDVWVVRVLGSVAAVCFILLLFSIMRVFI